MNNSYGLFFPIELEEGSPVQPGLFDSIDASIRHIMAYIYGTRYFNPAFGTIIHDKLGDANSDYNLEAVRRDLTVAIENWEPRINRVRVELTNLGPVTNIKVTGIVGSTRAGYELNTTI